MTRLITIESADDERLAVFRLNERGLATRAERRDDEGSGLFLAEGDLVVERALDAGCVPVAALADARRPPAVVERLLTGGRRPAAGIDVHLGGDEVRRMVTGLGVPQPVIALFHRPPRPTAAELVATSDRLVVLEGVDNPSNVGAIVRNAAALGWDGLLLDHTSADPLSRRSLRVAMGTAFSLPHARTNDLISTLGGPGAPEVVVLTPDAAAPDIAELTVDGPCALVIGSERHGVSAAVASAATHVARIPMGAGVDSLNAAAATAIACYVLRR